jgi:hypothetical protein
MRALVALGCVLGCGRINIDPLTDDNRADALPAVCVTDGVACDDSNICTVTSTCAAGVCAGPQVGPCEVANSDADFDIVQGTSGWYYGYWIAGSDLDGTYQPGDFVQFVWNVSVWEPPDLEPSGPNFSWAYLARWGGHPGSFPTQKLPVRRWISDVSGHADAVVYHAKADATGGDGTRAILFVDGMMVWSRDVDGVDGIGFTEAVPIELSIGTRVDLMLHYIGSDTIDTTNSSMIVRSR